MRRWITSIQLFLRRFSSVRPLHEIELENILLNSRVEWLRESLSSIERMAGDGAPKLMIMNQARWALQADIEGVPKFTNLVPASSKVIRLQTKRS